MSDIQIVNGDTTHPIVVLVVSNTDHITGVTGLASATLLAGSFISKNGAAEAAAAGSYTAVGGGKYAYNQTAAEVNTNGELTLSIRGVTGCDPADEKRQVVPFNIYDAVRLGLSAMPNANFGASGGLASQVSESGTAQAGASTTITLRAGASATDNLYTDQWVFLTGGTGVGQVRRISGYVGATKIATVDAAWQTNPDNTSTYEVLASARTHASASDVDPWATTLPGSYGANTAGSILGNTATASQVAGAVWDTTRGSHTLNGSFGQGVSSVQGNVQGNVTGSVNSVTTAVDILQSAADKVWSTVTRALTTSLDPTAQQIADAVMDNENIETGATFRQIMRGIAAAVMGAADSGPLGTRFWAAVSRSKPRVISADDVNGNRNTVTYDLTP